MRYLRSVRGSASGHWNYSILGPGAWTSEGLTITATVGLVGHGVKAVADMMAFPAVLRCFELPLGRYADLNP